MSKIKEENIKKEIQNIDKELEIINERYRQLVGEYAYNEEELDDKAEEYDYFKDEINSIEKENYELDMDKYKLQRLIDIKEEGDTYFTLYKNGYDNVIKRQKDYEITDLLSRRNDAKKLCNKIEIDEIKAAGIFGEWGTGKSTFMEYIKEELQQRNIQSIKIDASEYSDQEKIWAYIYSCIIEIFKQDKSRKIKYAFKRIKSILSFILINIVLVIAIPILLVYFKIDPFTYLLDNENIADVSKSFTMIMYIYLYLKYMWPKLLDINKQVIKTYYIIKKTIGIPCQDNILGYKVEIKKELDKILRIWNKKIVLLIDELDRCDDEVIVHFFDTLQLFQHSENIQIVYAVDRNTVGRALEKKNIPEKEISNYLKKYIDYGITLYSVNSNATIVENVIKEYAVTKHELIYIHSCICKEININITIRDLKEILNIFCEIKKEWLEEYIFTKKYEDDINYVVSLKKFIPWCIYSLIKSEWIMYIIEDVPTITKDIENDYVGMTLDHFIKTNQLTTKYQNCPKYFKDSRIKDILMYKEMIMKYM